MRIPRDTSPCRTCVIGSIETEIWCFCDLVFTSQLSQRRRCQSYTLQSCRLLRLARHCSHSSQPRLPLLQRPLLQRPQRSAWRAWGCSWRQQRSRRSAGPLAQCPAAWVTLAMPRAAAQVRAWMQARSPRQRRARGQGQRQGQCQRSLAAQCPCQPGRWRMPLQRQGARCRAFTADQGKKGMQLCFSLARKMRERVLLCCRAISDA